MLIQSEKHLNSRIGCSVLILNTQAIDGEDKPSFRTITLQSNSPFDAKKFRLKMIASAKFRNEILRKVSLALKYDDEIIAVNINAKDFFYYDNGNNKHLNLSTLANRGTFLIAEQHHKEFLSDESLRPPWESHKICVEHGHNPMRCITLPYQNTPGTEIDSFLIRDLGFKMTKGTNAIVTTRLKVAIFAKQRIHIFDRRDHGMPSHDPTSSNSTRGHDSIRKLDF